MPVEKDGLWTWIRPTLPTNFSTVNPFRLRLVVADDAVAQDGQGHGAHVFDVGAVFAGEGGVALGGHDEVLRSARSGTPAEVLVDLIRRVLAAWAGLGGQFDSVLDYVVGTGIFQNVLLEGGDLIGESTAFTDAEAPPVVRLTTSSSSAYSG